LALAGAASGLGDDDLEDSGQRDTPESCDLGRPATRLAEVVRAAFKNLKPAS
jgi:hypothetical protein